MKSLLDYDNRLMGPVGFICDLILLNLFFMLSCLPVFTAGAAIGGLHYASVKLLRREEGSIWKTYWKGMKGCFRQATGFWLAFLALAAVLLADLWVLPVMLPDFHTLPRIMVTLVLILLCAVMMYVLPLSACFTMPWRATLKNALLMLVGHFPQTLLLLLLNGGCLAVFLLPENIFLEIACVFLICGFSGVNFLATILLNNLFKRYESL